MKSYTSLYKKSINQPPNDAFAFFWFDKDNGETFETPYARLAQLAKPEKWNFIHEEYKKEGKDFPILMNYLNFTFMRLQEQNKIVYSKDQRYAVFNTGLLTETEKDIFAFFMSKENKSPSQSDWMFKFFADSYTDKLSAFDKTPEPATYITEARDIVFDIAYGIEINFDHILDGDNLDRLPKSVQSNPLLARNAIKGSIEGLKPRLLRNYKIAIPHWYKGRIQLLLPLHITDPVNPDVAMVAERDDSLRKYRIRTLLTMDMAYIDARLICRPDTEWLNP